MQLHRIDDVGVFLDRAGPFLGAREAEHCLIFGICSNVQAQPTLFGDQPPRFAVVTGDGGAVVAAALRTPPFPQVLSMIDDPAAIDLLVDGLDAPLPAVLGPSAAADRFASRWTERTGEAARLSVAERIFRLTRVIPPPATDGSWRLAEARDRDLLMAWIDAFRLEAVPEDPPPANLGAAADRWIARIGRTTYLWEDEAGRVVSLVGASGQTPHGIRIAPVYTPPERRGRGYASNLTAAASQDQLDNGRELCFLFTDLANPTSNKIYRQIGYQPVCDVNLYRFG
jgi:GNAT superfamily N-acetyltransferase